MKKSFEIEANLDVECEGIYRTGSSAKFNHIFGNYLPGDSETISNFKVYITVNNHRIEISDALSTKERDELMDTFLELCRDECEQTG